MTFIIGDVHAINDKLLALMQKIPKNSRVIFVGDLIDRGEQSKEVVKFVRQNGYECVMGNHEEFLIFGSDTLVKEGFEAMRIYHNIWLSNGGAQTLLSYGMVKYQGHRLKLIKGNEKLFFDDINWMKKLPLYIELDIKKQGKKVVISHAPIADIWHKRDDLDLLNEYALWNRDKPSLNAPIFNIFGHTIVQYVNLDKH